MIPATAARPPKIQERSARRILRFQAVGFALLISLSWLNELIDLPRLLFGSGGDSSIHEALMETAALLTVWYLVSRWTRRLLDRLHHLERFLRMCSWCRKLKSPEGEWVSVEDYFSERFDVATSHGMCPECQTRWMHESQEGARSKMRRVGKDAFGGPA